MTAYGKYEHSAPAKRNSQKRIDRDRQTLDRTVAKCPKITASMMTTELNQRLCDPVRRKAVSHELHRAGIYGRAATQRLHDLKAKAQRHTLIRNPKP